MRVLNEDMTEELFLTPKEQKEGKFKSLFLEDGEPVYIYLGPDYEFIEQTKINDLKSKLSSTDYKAIKYSEGLYTDEEYEPIKRYRQELRDQINLLEEKLNEL